jgi:hypothetical protein
MTCGHRSGAEAAPAAATTPSVSALPRTYHKIEPFKSFQPFNHFVPFKPSVISEVSCHAIGFFIGEHFPAGRSIELPAFGRIDIRMVDADWLVLFGEPSERVAICDDADLAGDCAVGGKN